MSKPPKALFISWSFIVLMTIFMIIWRTVEYGFFDGKDYLLWLFLPFAIYMAYKRKP